MNQPLALNPLVTQVEVNTGLSYEAQCQCRNSYIIPQDENGLGAQTEPKKVMKLLKCAQIHCFPKRIFHSCLIKQLMSQRLFFWFIKAALSYFITAVSPEIISLQILIKLQFA